MTTLLRPGYEKIFRVFYADKHKEFHLREMSRRTGLFGKSITRYIDEMVRAKLLISRMEGNQKKLGVRPDSRVFAFFAYFDTLRLLSLPTLRQQALSTFMETLVEKPVFAVIFGSTAKSATSEGSDIDLLLVFNRKTNTHLAEQRVDALHAISISVFQMTYAEAMAETRLRKDKVVQSALSTGFPIMNHIEYYKVLYARE